MPAANARDRNSRIGTIGACARSSQTTNAAASSTPAASGLMTSALAHPATLPRSRPHTSANAAAATTTIPKISKSAFGPKLSRRAHTNQGNGDQAKRKIDPEDPSPSEPLVDEAADGGPDNEGKS